MEKYLVGSASPEWGLTWRESGYSRVPTWVQDTGWEPKKKRCQSFLECAPMHITLIILILERKSSELYKHLYYLLRGNYKDMF